LVETLFRLRGISLGERKTTIELVVKCTEELGELAEAVLSYNNVPGNAHKGKTQNDMLLEAADVILVASAIMFAERIGIKEYCQLLNEKMDKWEAILKTT